MLSSELLSLSFGRENLSFEATTALNSEVSGSLEYETLGSTGISMRVSAAAPALGNVEDAVLVDADPNAPGGAAEPESIWLSRLP